MATLGEVLAQRQQAAGASDLDRAMTRYQNNQSILSMIGDAGKKSVGLLSFALAPLDYLGGIARAGIFSAYNALGAGIDVDRNDIQDDGNFFSNMRKAVLKNPFDPNQRIAGFGDIPGLKFSDDDSFLERLGKATVGFGGDVLSDPTTYLSFGIAPVAKKLAARGVSATTASAARSILAGKPLEIAVREGVEGATENAAEKIALAAGRTIMDTDSVLSRLAFRNKNLQNMADAANLPMEDFVVDLMQRDRDQLVEIVSNQIGDEATAIFRARKRGALKRYFNDLADETGVDEFKNLWEAQADAVRGGIQLTTPLGKPIKRLTEGGQSPLGDFIGQQSAKIAASRPGLFLTLGRDQELVRAAKQAGLDITKPGGLARAAQAENALRIAQAAAKEERQKIGKLSTQAKTIMAVAGRTGSEYSKQTDELGNNLGDVLDREVRRWYNDFDGEDRAALLSDDVEAYASTIDNPVSRDAYRIARSLRDFMYKNYGALKDELGEDFSDVGIVEGALRVLSEDAKSLQRDLFGVGSARAGMSGYKSRGSFFYTKPDGTFDRWYTLDEANAQQRTYLRNMLDEEVAAGRIRENSQQYREFLGRIEGLDWFETDPRKIFSRNVNRLERQVHKAVAVRLFKRAGLLVEGEADKGITPSGIVKAARDEIKSLRDEAALLTEQRTENLRLRPGAPSGETARLAQELADEARRVNEQFIRPVAPVEGLASRADEVVAASATDVGNLERVIDRSTDRLDELAVQIQERLTEATNLEAIIKQLGQLEPEEQSEAFGALLDTIITMKKSQADRLAAVSGNITKVQDLRKAAENLMEAKKRQATAVINLTGRAEPMVRLGTVPDKKGRLVEVESQLANLWAPQIVSDALANSYKITNETRTVVEEALRQSTNIWKQWATFGRGPSFIFRNLGGWWNAFLVGTNGADFKEGLQYAIAYERGLKIFRDEVAETKDINQAVDLLEKSLREAMKDKTLAGMSMYDAHRMMEDEGIFGGTLTAAAVDVDPKTNVPRSVSAADVYGRGRQDILRAPGEEASPWERVREGQLSVGEAIKVIRKGESGAVKPTAALSTVAKQAGKGAVRATINNPYMYVMRALSEDSERFLRSSTFASGIRQYGKDAVGFEMASMLVKASQFDYTDLSPSEQRVMKLISPFFVWTKNNVPYQFRNLFANPGKVNAILKLQENVKKQFQDEDQDMSEYMPAWLAEQMGFASTFGSGENQLALSLNLPLADLNRFFEVPVDASGRPDITLNPASFAMQALNTAAGGAGDDVVGSASPFVKFPIETLTGVNLFTGAKFGQQAAGPGYRVATELPLIGRLLPGTYTDPETGEIRSSSYAINQFRNLFPQAGQLDRLLPFGQQGEAKQRLLGNYVSQGLSFLPVTVSATLTESQYSGELRTRNQKLEQQIREYERSMGLPEGSLREQLNESQKMLSTKSRQRALAAALAP